MNDLAITSRRPTLHDFAAGLVVFLVAMPLCMGIATASNAPAVAGLISGIVGGIVVGLLSGSATSVTGPAGGLIPIVALQIASLGSFQAFLLAAVVAGVIQIVLGIARLGFLASFAPTSVVKGLLAAIGIIIVLKQIPHLIGNDLDPQGEMSFFQTNQRTTFSAIMAMFAGFHPGAAVIGFVSLGILILWGCSSRLKQAWIPGSLVAMAVAVVLSESFSRLGPQWAITGNHLLNVPVPENGGGYLGYLTFPDFAQWNNPDVYRAAFVIAVVGSLESLLSLEAIDRIDPLMRESPTNRELIAQGVGNSLAALIGGIPMTIVIIRSSIGLSLGARTRATTIVQGVLLLAGLTMFPGAINRIPLAAIAAVLIASGSRLANPQILRRLYVQGGDQFLPFLATVIAIVFTDVLTGLLVGLAISTGFVLRSNLLRPMRRIRERHPSGEVLRIELPNQVSFLNKASLERSLMQIPPGGHVVIDGRQTDSIDSDVRTLIEDFREKAGPVRGVQVSLLGFDAVKHGFDEEIHYVDYVDREVQGRMTPQRVFEILSEGNQRFRAGRHLTRDFSKQAQATALGQHPLACILGCIDSRSPTELVFDAGLGDLFSVRIAGNVVSRKVLGSIEYACSVGGAKLVVVMGHTRCGAVGAAVTLLSNSLDGQLPEQARQDHVQYIVDTIAPSIDETTRQAVRATNGDERQGLIDGVAQRHVSRMIESIREESPVLSTLEQQGRIAIVGAMYDVRTGAVAFMTRPAGSPVVAGG